MTTGKRNVVVKQLPSSLDGRQQQLFLEDVESSMALRRPSLVLDCSRLQELDADATHLILHCLEAALKRNGDVKLAALPARAQGVFAAAGLERLFDLYDTAAEAVASFSQARSRNAPRAAVALLQTAPA
jgi:anti-anti-sigma factor